MYATGLTRIPFRKPFNSTTKMSTTMILRETISKVEFLPNENTTTTTRCLHVWSRLKEKPVVANYFNSPNNSRYQWNYGHQTRVFLEIQDDPLHWQLELCRLSSFTRCAQVHGSSSTNVKLRLFFHAREEIQNLVEISFSILRIYSQLCYVCL